MNAVVCVKRVPDTATRIRIAAGGKGIDPANVEHVLNPYDENAVEEALRQRDRDGKGEVVAVTAGPPESQAILLKALAMGADRGVHAVADLPFGDGAAAAAALSEAIRGIPFDLLLFGKQAVDDDLSEVPWRVAAALGVPIAGLVTRLEIEGRTARIEREVEGGHEILELPLPAAVTCQKGLNEPRYPSLKGIMGAKRKPIETRPAARCEPRLAAVSLSLPPPRSKGRVVGSGAAAAPELVRLLREEAKVL